MELAEGELAGRAPSGGRAAGRRKFRTRDRASGPVGVLARGGSPDAIAAAGAAAGRDSRIGPAVASAPAAGCAPFRGRTLRRRVDPGCHGPGRLRLGRTSALRGPVPRPRPGRGRVRRAAVGPAQRCRAAAVAGQRRVGIVDLGHPLGRDRDAAGIVAGQVGVVRPGQPAPGGLDLGRAGATLDTKDDMGVAVSPRRPV